MKRIETEYGVAYIGDPEELEQFEGGRLIDPEVTRPVGEDKWLDPDKFRTSWVMVSVIALGFMIVGLFIGLVLMGDPDFRLTGFITIIAMAIVFRYARIFLVQYESTYMDMVAEARQEELRILTERKAADARQVKILNAAKKAQVEVNKEAKLTGKGLKFTSDDFDDAAQALLLKPVKDARKKKLKVSGQGLIETILKGMK
jgi:hypothetical protein